MGVLQPVPDCTALVLMRHLSWAFGQSEAWVSSWVLIDREFPKCQCGAEKYPGVVMDKRA